MMLASATWSYCFSLEALRHAVPQPSIGALGQAVFSDSTIKRDVSFHAPSAVVLIRSVKATRGGVDGPVLLANAEVQCTTVRETEGQFQAPSMQARDVQIVRRGDAAPTATLDGTGSPSFEKC